MGGSRPNYTHIGSVGVPKAVKTIMIVSGSIHVLSILGGQAFTFALWTSFGLIPAAVTTSLALWQLGTYIFLHGDFWHPF